MKRINLLLIPLTLFVLSCSNKQNADLLIYNATIYTVDSAFSTAEAMVIKDGRILATGTRADLEKSFTAAQLTDAEGKFIY
ncbi:MAG: amidohydrolase, partial [Chitinophagaceae bacterium]|nr:amidohydrolase [Chitinophagaceae bacterium]